MPGLLRATGREPGAEIGAIDGSDPAASTPGSGCAASGVQCSAPPVRLAAGLGISCCYSVFTVFFFFFTSRGILLLPPPARRTTFLPPKPPKTSERWKPPPFA